jgi:antitoxin component HigA of HigAB toxin-antitoxin module
MNEKEFRVAIKRVDTLVDLAALTPEQEQELDQLANQIRAYEDEHCPIREPTPEELDEFRRDQGMIP